VIEQLSSERAGQALSEGIHVRRAYRGAHDSRPGRLEYVSEASTEPSCRGRKTSTSGAPSMVAFLACCAHHPAVGPYVDRGMDDPSAAEVEEEEHEDFANRMSYVWNQVARPRDVVAQERRPALAVAWGPGAADVPLDGPLGRRGRRA